MDAITPLILAKALDGLSTRYAATAENIANANTPNYRALRVRFEDSLRAAAAKGPEAVAKTTTTTDLAPLSKISNEFRLDLEVANASQTAGRYAALSELLGRELQLDRAVLAGDR